MITRMDRDVEKILDLLRELEIEENTLIFTSDNGPHNGDAALSSLIRQDHSVE